MDKHYLFPGYVFASRKPYVVDTILGSCVAVTLWDDVLRFGSINHFMLPRWNGEGEPTFKYGDVAIAEIVKLMEYMGSDKEHLKAKVFGGSEITSPKSVYNIGERNVNTARQTLLDYDIPVVSFSIGGGLGRKLVFNSYTGEVLIKFIQKGVETAPTNFELINHIWNERKN